MGEVSQPQEPRPETQVLTGALVSTWLRQLGTEADTFIDQPGTLSADRFGFIMPKYLESADIEIVDIPQLRMAADGALQIIRGILNADNIYGRQEETTVADIANHRVSVVIWQAILDVNPSNYQKYKTPIGVSVTETHPIEGYPDDLLGITATVRLSKPPVLAQHDATQPKQPQQEQ